MILACAIHGLGLLCALSWWAAPPYSYTEVAACVLMLLSSQGSAWVTLCLINTDEFHVLRFSQASLGEMIAPGALVMLTPLVVGILFGTRTLSGILAGALVSGVQMAVSMSNTGGAWDNAKKYVEVRNMVLIPGLTAALPTRQLITAPMLRGTGCWI